MPQPASQRALLELVGGLRLPDLNGLDWQVIAQLAALHRLEPLPHWRYGKHDAIPSEVRAEWQEAYRIARMAAPAQDAELG